MPIRPTDWLPISIINILHISIGNSLYYIIIHLLFIFKRLRIIKYYLVS